ncbi:MAG TPA: hypothetical protein VNQ90_09395 [Chthoniobacteraceae bacterium]|nr:hypothetical protein [Chthoniobacteraceae bacterium]
MVARLLGFSLLLLSLPGAASAQNRLPPPGGNPAGAYWSFSQHMNGRGDTRLETVTGPEGKPVAALYLRLGCLEGTIGRGSAPPLAVTPGTKWRFSAWVRGETLQPLWVRIEGSAESSWEPRLIAETTGEAGAFPWRRIERRFAIPADVGRVRVTFLLGGGEGSLWIAEPSLVPDSTTETPPVPARAEGGEAAAAWMQAEGGGDAPRVVYTRRVELPAVPAYATARIMSQAPGHFRVNGHEVTPGLLPDAARGFEIARYLQKGENRFEIETEAAPVLFAARIAGVAPLLSGAAWTAATAGGEPLKTVTTGEESGFRPAAPPLAVEAKQIGFSSTVAAGKKAVLELECAAPIADEALASLEWQFFEEGESVALSGLSPVFHRKGRRLTVELPLSRWARPGRYEWRLRGPGMAISTPNALPLEVEAAPLEGSPEQHPWFTAGPSNVVRTAAGSQSPFSASLPEGSPVESYRAWSTSGGHQYELYYPAAAFYRPGGWELARLEAAFFRVLEADPAASILVRLRFETPDWWNQKYPDELYLSNRGTRRRQSFGSDAWREFAIRCAGDLATALRQRPVGRAFGGFLIMGFEGGEFQLWGHGQGEYDCSPAAGRAFAQWQETHGVPTGERVTLPHPALAWPFRKERGDGVIRSRFFRFVAQRQAENLAVIINAIKAEHPTLACAVHYGYLFEHANSLRRLLYGGSLGFADFIASAKVDAVSNITSYSLRGNRRGHAFMLPVTSLALRGIQPSLEDDVRNFLWTGAADTGGAPLRTVEESLRSMRKIRYLAATQGAAVRYNTGFGNGKDLMQAPEILSELAALNRRVMALKPLPPGSPGEVALVVDPLALTGLSEWEEGEALSRAALSEVRDTLARTGRPAALVTMDDWKAHAEKWEHVVIPLPGLLSAERLAALAEEFGPLPAFPQKALFLVLAKGGEAAIAETNDALWQQLATRRALNTPQPAWWYIGRNFTAVATPDEVRETEQPEKNQ